MALFLYPHPTFFMALKVLRLKDPPLWTVRAQSSSDSQDGVVGLSGPTHLNIAEADLVEHVAVLGQWAFPALSLHQHVEGEELSHDGPSSVLKKQGLHQQDAAACQEDKVSERPGFYPDRILYTGVACTCHGGMRHKPGLQVS